LPIETSHPASILLAVDFDGTPRLETYGAAPGTSYPVQEPQVETIVAEPGTLTLVGLGILAWRRASRRRRANGV
jgi:hypothetical protein